MKHEVVNNSYYNIVTMRRDGYIITILRLVEFILEFSLTLLSQQEVVS